MEIHNAIEISMIPNIRAIKVQNLLHVLRIWNTESNDAFKKFCVSIFVRCHLGKNFYDLAKHVLVTIH